MELPRTLHHIADWLHLSTPAGRVVAQNLAIWAIAGGLVWYISRGLSFKQTIRTLEHSDLALFVSANIAVFLLRWLMDTYLFSCLFSFFHQRTTYREVLPASTAQYFLQALNILIADGAMVLFLHQRKGVEWLTAGWTMAFQGFVDAILMSALTVTMGLLVPSSPIHLALPYAAGALVFLLGAAAWWMWGRSTSRLGQWLRNRRGMRAFRLARPRHYAILGSIRLAMYVPNALAFYVCIIAFRLEVPLASVLAMGPALMFAQSAPITPSGIGPLQAVMVEGFSKFAPRAELFTAALGVSILQLLCRLPMGIGAAGTFARQVLSTGHGDVADIPQRRERL